MALAALAQPAPAPRPTPALPWNSGALSASETITTRVREVNVVFSVTDRRGRFVPDLERKDIAVFDNDTTPPSLAYFLKHDDLPLHVALVIDLSDSIHEQFGFEQKSAALFLEQVLRPASDAALVIGFNHRPIMQQGMTHDPATLAAGLARLKVGGTTALFDAVEFACAQLADEAQPSLARRVVVLITDGQDTASRGNLKSAINAALQTGTVIFGVNTAPGSTEGEPVLKRLAGATGGVVFPGRGLPQLAKAFHGIEGQVRSQYALGYKPPGWNADRSFHKIRVAARRRGLRIHHRTGYFAVD